MSIAQGRISVTSTSFINEDFPAPSSENPTIAIPDIYINTSSTMIYKFALNNGTITYSGKAKVAGTVNDQFSLDEFNDHFRIATTTDWPSSNSLYVLDMGGLAQMLVQIFTIIVRYSLFGCAIELTNQIEREDLTEDKVDEMLGVLTVSVTHLNTQSKMVKEEIEELTSFL